MHNLYKIQTSVPINNVLLKQGHAHSFIAYGCFCTTKADLNDLNYVTLSHCPILLLSVPQITATQLYLMPHKSL